MEGKKVLHFVPSGKFHRVTAGGEKTLHGATWAKCVRHMKKLPTVYLCECVDPEYLNSFKYFKLFTQLCLCIHDIKTL